MYQNFRIDKIKLEKCNKEVLLMVKILVSIHNGLLAEAMTAMLSESGEFEPFPISAGSRNGDIAKDCVTLGAEMVLMEVSYSNGTAVE